MVYQGCERRSSPDRPRETEDRQASGGAQKAPWLEPGKWTPKRGVREGARAMSFSRRMITLRRRLGLFVLVTAVCYRKDRGRQHSV